MRSVMGWRKLTKAEKIINNGVPVKFKTIHSDQERLGYRVKSSQGYRFYPVIEREQSKKRETDKRDFYFLYSFSPKQIKEEVYLESDNEQVGQ